MHFEGFTISDWAAIDQLGSNYVGDIETSINAGLDMVMIPNGPGHKNNYIEFFEGLRGLVKAGRVPQTRLDDAARRILRVKIQMGVLDHPFVDPWLRESIGSPEHRQIARQCVRESLVLLKNEREALPMSKAIKRVLVIGKAADDLGMQCGGWTISWQGAAGPVTPGGTTILSGLRQSFGKDVEVTFSPDATNLKRSDVTIAVIGEPPYAEGNGDRTDLEIAPADAALIAKAKELGAPLITILLSGRPMILGSALDQSDAFVAAWLPGTEGQGLADVILGRFPFTGRLTHTWPRNGQQVAVSNSSPEPALFPRGFGLTYSRKTVKSQLGAGGGL
jgi:beta-glucosidase